MTDILQPLKLRIDYLIIPESTRRIVITTLDSSGLQTSAGSDPLVRSISHQTPSKT